MVQDRCMKITTVTARDIRWPTSLGAHGSDAMHTDPDYSCVYVTIATAEGLVGYGMTFTLGRGTDIVLLAVRALKHLVEGRTTASIYERFGQFWRDLTSESQLRWIGPEKGVTHLAVAAIINALWDLWGKIRNVPVWQLLAEMEPAIDDLFREEHNPAIDNTIDNLRTKFLRSLAVVWKVPICTQGIQVMELVSTIDFRYIEDVITPEEAIALLEKNKATRNERMQHLLKHGYPAYTTQIGWLGYSDDMIRALCKKYLAAGFKAFKMKVGQDLESDIKRCQLVREEIGWENQFMVDANQTWDVPTAIVWMKKLKEFKLLWIEEPTSPDDVLGHAKIAEALREYSIGVATGEMCCNRVMFKQFMQANALEFCQIDSARIGGVNEILSVYLMANKLNIKVCPHAGGVGLCEMVQHLQMWDFCSVSCTMEGRMVEFVDQQHDQFVNPAIINENACYVTPKAPGYSTELKSDAIAHFEYPHGSEWQRMFAEGIFKPENY